ncbi:MAG: hypothetical protein V1660_01940 [archaeon]
MKYLLRKLLNDKSVQKEYIEAGSCFGDAASYVCSIGQCIGFEALLERWAMWEKEYAKRGYRTICYNNFELKGGYNKDIGNVIGVKRKENEEAIFHAHKYKEKYLGKIKPGVNIEKMMKDGESQSGSYIPPITEE